MTTQKYEMVILGAGLAGLSTADAFQKAGYSVCVLEKETIAAGASGTPGGLINLATGRRGKKVWRAEQCYRAIRRNLQKAKPFSRTPFYWQNGVLRPAQTEKMARKMREQFDSTSWDPKLCRWLNREQIMEKHPGIHCVEGGLWLPGGMAVDVPSYLNSLAGYLRKQGVKIYENVEASLSPVDDEWALATPTEISFITPRVIFANGYQILESPHWSFLPLEPVKGQVALFESDRPCGFGHSISSLGYVARLNDPNRFVMGSTYEHDFDSLETDREGEEYLRKRLRRTLPDLEERSEVIEQWAGVRMSAPNYKPIIGEHSDRKGLFCYTGLGSKGLLYSRYLADLFVEYIRDGKALPEEMSLKAG